LTDFSFQPSALYALASGNVPEPIREEFIQRAEAGETIRHQDVKRRLAIVDRETGEILDDPEIDVEYVDPSDPASFLPDPTPPVSVDDIARKDPDVERARMLRLYKTAISQTTNNLLPLKPAAVVASLSSADIHGTRRFIASLRDWCDTIEAEMGQGVRLIHRKEA
jgi:hypothetical protein